MKDYNIELCSPFTDVTTEETISLPESLSTLYIHNEYVNGGHDYIGIVWTKDSEYEEFKESIKSSTYIILQEYAPTLALLIIRDVKFDEFPDVRKTFETFPKIELYKATFDSRTYYLRKAISITGPDASNSNFHIRELYISTDGVHVGDLKEYDIQNGYLSSMTLKSIARPYIESGLPAKRIYHTLLKQYIGSLGLDEDFVIDDFNIYKKAGDRIDAMEFAHEMDAINKN